MDIKTITDNVKAIREIAETTQNIELKSLIVDLKEEILELRQENQELKERLFKKEDFNMVYENKVYWQIKKDGTKDGPFCPVCWDTEKKAIRIGDEFESYTSVFRYCYHCKNNIQIR